MRVTASISSTERYQEILTMLRQRNRVGVRDLCDHFGISEATARRDLDFMQAHGMIQRVYGGAIARGLPSEESPMLDRENLQRELKQRIAQEAANMIQDGETLFLGSGTTVLALARMLTHRHGLTVITNALPVINVLSQSDHHVIGLGGELRSSELSFVGHLTEQAVSQLRADQVILGTPAVSLQHGLTHDYLPETMTDRAVLKIASRVILLADHTKFGRVATSYVAPLEVLHTIVTDDGLDIQLAREIENRGVRVIRCAP